MKRTLFAALLFTSAIARAQGVAQPAEESAEHEASENPRGAWHLRSWEEPAYGTTVSTTRLREEELIGEYHQPRWTANRRFPTTRIYVLPKGTVNAEYWLTPRVDLSDGTDLKFRSMYEVEYGLGYRLQLDLYMTTEQEGVLGPLELTEEKIELRWALADWGTIYSNPTLYAEFVRHNGGPPKIEAKLLLGDEFAPHWHWGANLVWERVLGGQLKQEYSITAAASYTFIDMYLSGGIEFVAKMYDHEGSRFDLDTYSLMAGPSIVWRPVVAMRLLLVGLFGATVNNLTHTTTPIAEPTLIVSWEF